MNTKSEQKSTISKKDKNSKSTYSTGESLVKIPIFGVGITNATTDEILEYLLNVIENSGKNIYVVTPNPEMMVFAQHDNGFKTILNGADLALCDGMQLYRAARMLGIPLKERIIGTDFVEKVCEKVADWPITVGFVGGGPKIAEQASDCLRHAYPTLNVVFCEAEWDEQKPHPEIDILFVALGAPKQEKWMAEHLNKIPVRVMMGIGGALDQIAHPTLRPPKLVHALGMGWMYRLVREPWRIKRQAKLREFVGMVWRERFNQG